MNTSKTYLKKKSLVSFISFILFIAISFSNLGGLFQSKVSAATNGYVNSSVTTSLNVRSRASAASSIVTKITAGQRVTIIAEVAAEIGYIKPEDIERLKKFRANPSDESWIGGNA